MAWCVCVMPSLWRDPPTYRRRRVSAEGLQEQGPFRTREVRAHQLPAEAAEPLAQPVQVTLVSDGEKDGRPGGRLGLDALELLLGEPHALEVLIEGADSGAGRRPQNRREEQRPDHEPPERSPSPRAHLVLMGVPQRRLRGSRWPLQDGTVDDLDQPGGSGPVELVA